MSKSLAITYRPTNWDDVVEQDVMKKILQSQIEKGTFRHAYLFTGPAGCGKTTCARIFAHEINNGAGTPLEMDAASNNSVDNVRELIQQARLKSLDSEYKIFILDECHALSNNAWQAMLKMIEEPPAKSVFIFCTTDPQKIPATIISRVQRYDFQRISTEGITNRLYDIIAHENTYGDGCVMCELGAVEYIAKLADGGMRDAITMLDKCIAFSSHLTIKSVVETLGTVDYDVMFALTEAFIVPDVTTVIEKIETLYSSGKDLKQFIKSYIQFITDIAKFATGCSLDYIQIPTTREYVLKMEDCVNRGRSFNIIIDILDVLVRLNMQIKYSGSPKYDIESEFMLLCERIQNDS